jgi:hypothetical protein
MITTDSKVLPLTLGIIAGASMGALILILFIIIGLLLICMIRIKANKHRKGINQVESTTITPFDDIQMYSPVPVTDKCETDEASRVSKMFLESNISYDCPQNIISTPQTNENIYACIH